jgi:hypothetical protein
MDNIVATLQAQHQAVLKMVGKINEKVARGEVKGLNSILGELKTALLAHLELEDNQLYPSLIKAADALKNPGIAQTTRMFSGNMVQITDTLKGFLGKFEGKDIDPAAFKTDWNQLIGVLSARITSEEATLYPMYNQWVPTTKKKKG